MTEIVEQYSAGNHPEKSFLQSMNGLRVSRKLSEHPWLGFCLFIIGTLIFSLITYAVLYHKSWLAFDIPIAIYFHTLAITHPHFWVALMEWPFYIGYQGIIILAVLLAGYYVYKRYWLELIFIVVGQAGASMIFFWINHLMFRARPSAMFPEPVWLLRGASASGFPSGHAVAAIVITAFLIYLYSPRINSKVHKWIAGSVAVFLLIFMAVSRLYLADHYLSDVIAGYALGIAWFGLVCTCAELLFRKYPNLDGKVAREKDKQLQ